MLYYITKRYINQGLHKKSKNDKICQEVFLMLDLEKCKDEFLKYTEKYNLSNEKLKRKQLHSLRVMKKSRIIAQSLKLSEEEIQIATLIGLLHDIGRFEQYTKYNTFSDHNSIDHAELGIRILQENNYIKNYIEDEN